MWRLPHPLALPSGLSAVHSRRRTPWCPSEFVHASPTQSCGLASRLVFWSVSRSGVWILRIQWHPPDSASSPLALCPHRRHSQKSLPSVPVAPCSSCDQHSGLHRLWLRGYLPSREAWLPHCSELLSWPLLAQVPPIRTPPSQQLRSEEHTSEL